jgi:hypothetical protein
MLHEFLYTVNESLEEGGYFIGTMMSGEKTYKLLHALSNGDSYSFRKKGQSIISLTKHFENTPLDVPAFGLNLDIKMPDNTIVGDQNEYLAFFTLLQEACEQMGLQLVYMYDFLPSDKLQFYEKEFSSLNIGFIFQKLPLHFSKKISPSSSDETFEFINLFSNEQSLIRTGVAQNHSFVRSVLYNTIPTYRSTIGQRDVLVDSFIKELSLPEQITLDLLSSIMKRKNINIYIIDSHTRRPIRLEGYDVSRSSIVLVCIQTIAPDGTSVLVYEPLASNIKGMAKRVFFPLDSQIVCIHRAMMRGK